VFDTTPLAHFSSSPGAIYPALRRLEQRGLLQAALDRARETRPRRVFSLTPAGEQTLDAWLRQPVTRDEIIRSNGAPILRFSLAGGRLATNEVVAYLRKWQQVLTAYVEELRGHQAALAAMEQAPAHALLALENGLRGFESELGWIDSAMKQITRRGRGGRARR
jgi:DNA-binding PadR family transcriptional regulator